MPRVSASPSSSSCGRRSPKAPTDGQPKTSREQFSACGACRMRRVRCDLKDLPMHKTGRHPSCTNCKERNLKCVDEYGQVKSVKLLRRGRRLQQAEAIYGKVQPGEEEDILLSGPVPPNNVIPMLKPEFFDSPFWRKLHLQRPIIEPIEFHARFGKGHAALGIPGRLLAMSLVVWASSFGFNESGQPIDSFEDQMLQFQEQKINSQERHDPAVITRLRNTRRTRTNEMVKEMLYLIDIHAILRKPTWDGVRVLLMILPLTQDVQSNLERLTMYESTISLVYGLSSLAGASPVDSGQGVYVDSLVRARVFWSSIMHDWMVNGLRGGRMLLSDHDLRSFEETLPSLDQTNERSSPDQSHYHAYTTVYRFFSIPLQLCVACRLVHDALTGPEAKKKNVIDEEGLQRAWDILDKAWQQITQVRSWGLEGTMLGSDEIESYIASWQIFMFECSNIIREALRAKLSIERPAAIHEYSIVNSPHDYYSTVNKLYLIAQTKSLYYVQSVLTVIKHYLGTSFFQHDALLVRDGVFYAGFLLASEAREADDINLCLSALREMRWAFSKSEERENTIRTVWQAARSKRGRQTTSPHFTPPYNGRLYTATDSLPRVDVNQLGIGSPAPTSAGDEQWTASAISGSSESSSPHSYITRNSPVEQSTNMHPIESSQHSFTTEGYLPPLNSGIQAAQFEQFHSYTQPQRGKPSNYAAQPSDMYYQQEYLPPVAPYYPDRGEEVVQSPSGSLSGPSNYQAPFYYQQT